MLSPIRFFLEFSSPYAYLAAQKIDAVGRKHGRQVIWTPVSLAHVWKAIGYGREILPEQRRDYMVHDWTRCAQLDGIPLRMPKTFPVDAKLARLVFWRLSLRDGALAHRFAQAVFRQYWAEGQDIRTAEQLALLCRDLALDPAELDLAAEDEEAKQLVIEATRLAVSKGMFGAPFFTVEDQTFWGADRVDHIDRWLSARAQAA